MNFVLGSLGAFAFGTVFGWTSPTSIQLQGENEYFKLSLVEFGWIASMMNIGCIFSAILVTFTLDRLGRKKTMLLLVFPIMIGWILIIFAQNFTMMLIGRLLCGFAGPYSVVGPQYTSEIAEKEIRGILGTFMQLLFVNGLLFVYIVGAFVNIFWLSLLSASIPLIFVLLFIYMPESPHFLIASGRKNEAILALKWLRSPNYNVLREVEEIEKEFEKHQTESVSFWEAFHTRATYRATFIAFGLMFFFNFSGMVIVHFYVKDILEV
jgi:MFS family permease